tara:strand:+ start:547 stop:882 length:336 start_codon:yes stop_codon:yes gene_type:complete
MSSHHTEDDEDAIGLLNEERKVKTPDAKPWKSWVIPTICLVIGFGMGALFHSDAVAISSGAGASTGVGGHAHTEEVADGKEKVLDLSKKFRTCSWLFVTHMNEKGEQELVD